MIFGNDWIVNRLNCSSYRLTAKDIDFGGVRGAATEVHITSFVKNIHQPILLFPKRGFRGPKYLQKGCEVFVFQSLKWQPSHKDYSNSMFAPMRWWFTHQNVHETVDHNSYPICLPPLSSHYLVLLSRWIIIAFHYSKTESAIASTILNFFWPRYPKDIHPTKIYFNSILPSSIWRL